jgi:L-ascorbate metabolism protein UlaG (beta-lactamase superfamily)
MRTDNYRGYNGYLIEVGRHQVLFGGDTAFTTALRKARTDRPLDLAIMPIGAYDPWIRNHCSPEEALTMAEHANADRILPVHHLTFKLSREPLHEPLERLLTATRGQTDRVLLGEIGQQVSL